MQPIALFLYAIFSLVYGLLAIFVVYHLRRYMLNRANANLIVLIFLIGMAVLYMLNFSFFWALPLDSLSSGVWVNR